MRHTVEVDQSGRIDDTKVPTVLAFSDGENFSILIPAKVKRDCIHHLRQLGLSGPTFYIQLFATGLFFLLRNHIEKINQVVIDIEFFGKENLIREHLINLFNRRGSKKVDPAKIQFHRIGKKSPAHFIALQTFRRTRKPNLSINQRELLAEFSQ